MQNCRCRQNKNEQTCRTYSEKETPFKVDPNGLCVDVENYCSDPMNPCTIKTSSLLAWCRYIYLLWQQILNAYRHAARTEQCKKHFRIQCCRLHAFLPILNAPMSAPMPPKHENKQMINIDFNTILKQIKTLPCLFGFARAYERACAAKT